MIVLLRFAPERIRLHTMFKNSLQPLCLEILFSINDCGLMLEPQEGMKAEEIVSFADYAERSGYGYIFRSDHLLPTSGQTNENGSPECWVTLGTIAGRTEKVKFGPLVSPVGWRNPALLARMACTLDSYSNGRMCLGFGAGWYESEYKAHGFEFPPVRIRLRQLEEACVIIRTLTLGRKVDYDGAYFSAHVECFPKPSKGHVHLIGGGRNPKVVETLASHVDEWNIFGSSVAKLNELKPYVDKGSKGRNIAISHMGSVLFAESEGELERKIEDWSKRRGIPARTLTREALAKRGIISGTKTQFIAELNSRIEAGMSKFYFQILNPEDKDSIQLLTDTLRSI
jgi:alkanesulfonate monooxygenase SsuD/methylene tetrahydromethanopterin reductase-like flavin-dependent oxidoreductase (luciferase family)